MLNKSFFAVLRFACCLAVLAGVIILFYGREQGSCMHVPIISEKELKKYTQTADFDIEQLLFNGAPAAVDISHDTIYISQSAGNLTHYTAMQGTLISADPAWSLFFLDNAPLHDLANSVQNGTPLSLIVASGGRCQMIHVIVTSLPVVRLDGTLLPMDEEPQNVFGGSVTLWAGADTEAYSTQRSVVQWHVRGNTTASQQKKSWKLSLKKENGENNNLNFLGLGSDDDWILNSLTMDDTKIKEKLFMDVWNGIAKETQYNYPMSSGEYTEVVINGSYMGIYLLQRRLDAKYLQLSDSDVLLKVTHYGAASAREAYEFVTSETNTDAIYSLMEGIYTKTDCSSLQINNLVDVNLMILLTNARDNCGLKNMYHLLKDTSEGFAQYLIPWDTDQSLGVVWKLEEGFCYDMEQSLQELSKRIETDAVAANNPQYLQLERQRWFMLRSSCFSEDSLLGLVEDLQAELIKSGALERDLLLWGNRYGGEDSVEHLTHFLLTRLPILDENFR